MIRALILSSLLILSSCASERIVYKVVYREIYPDVPIYAPVTYPPVPLFVWGDYRIYKEQCQALIDESNLNLKSVYEILEKQRDKAKEF